MAQPVTRGDWLRFSVPVFSAMIDQDAGVGFLGQNVFYAGLFQCQERNISFLLSHF